MTLAGLGGLGPWELIIILAIALVVFGAGKLPQIGGSLGEAIKNFKKGVKGEETASPPSKDKNEKQD